MKHKTEREDIFYHMGAAGIAAAITFPLWRATAIAQSGFKMEGSNWFDQYMKAVLRPPYRGVMASMLGMTWARGAIFFGSDYGKQLLEKRSDFSSSAAAQTLPPMIVGTIVQVINMPLVRATVTLQDPQCKLLNVREALLWIYRTRGVFALWHGVSAGILKTVPKYVSAVTVKNFMEDTLPAVKADDSATDNSLAALLRTAVKSGTAGVAGAVVTNPLSVLRNEMFKTDLSLTAAFKKLLREEGWKFLFRGVGSNMIAVAIPFTLTLFISDTLLTWKYERRQL